MEPGVECTAPDTILTELRKGDRQARPGRCAVPW